MRHHSDGPRTRTGGRNCDGEEWDDPNGRLVKVRVRKLDGMLFLSRGRNMIP